MPKFIVQLRRGSKEQWEEYEKNKPTESMPLAGELVVEYDGGVPRLKIGDGVRPYSQLPYMSVDSFIAPKSAYITLYADKWVQSQDSNGNPINQYSQVVKNDAENINQFKNAIITSKSKIDLQPSPDQLIIFHEKDLAFVTENEDGVVTIFCIGQEPTNDYIIHTTITEIAVD